MRRREALRTIATGATALAMPRLARAAGADTLVFAPQADLAQLDPVWVTAYVTRNAVASIRRWASRDAFGASLHRQAACVQ